MRSCQFVLLLLMLRAAPAAEFDTIGLTQLRALDPTLVGTGVRVAQPEAGDPEWEINPAAVAQPQSLFTWTSNAGMATNFPNAVGTESGHANQVAYYFFGGLTGVAPGVAHVENFEAGYFYDFRIQNQTAIEGAVVNQSFIFAGQLANVDLDYDQYAAHFNTLFVSGIGNGGNVNSPATGYNGIGVGAFGGASSVGPTADGRSKPDLVAPALVTSFSTPLVAGAAAILRQAGGRDDGGPATASAATDARTMKALLLNGAEKPLDWTNTSTRPLDARYGAGILNVLNAYRQLRGFRRSPAASVSVQIGDPHPPPNNTNNTPGRRGWDFHTISSSVMRDGVNHYFVDLSMASNRLFTFTGTLVWQRAENEIGINDLDLFLFDAADGTLVASSQSLVDNVEHIYLKDLPPKRYNLQVFKHGGFGQRLFNVESYALAFDFGPPESARFSNTTVATGQFQSRLTGEPNQNYVVQDTTNLVDWVAVLTNRTSAAGFLDFVDELATAPGPRFYRAREAP
jgi:Subtilase family